VEANTNGKQTTTSKDANHGRDHHRDEDDCASLRQLIKEGGERVESQHQQSQDGSEEEQRVGRQDVPYDGSRKT
jgi:hypothetical protein